MLTTVLAGQRLSLIQIPLSSRPFKVLNATHEAEDGHRRLIAAAAGVRFTTSASVAECAEK